MKVLGVQRGVVGVVDGAIVGSDGSMCGAWLYSHVHDPSVENMAGVSEGEREIDKQTEKNTKKKKKKHMIKMVLVLIKNVKKCTQMIRQFNNNKKTN